MKKDAYYFPHFSNARHDRKLRRVRKELGVEGYGIYFMLLETLRDQEMFRYPIEDLDLLADEFGTSEQKIRTVICNYDLFQVIELDGKESFVSMKFVEYLQPYLDNKHRNRINGIKGNLIKYKYITKEIADTLTDVEILELDEQRKNMLLIPSGGDSGGEQPSDRKESKRNKRNKRKEYENTFIPPTLLEVESYILEKEYVINPKQFFDYYEADDWMRPDGKPVSNWKRTVVSWNNRELKSNPNSKPYKKKEQTEYKNGTYIDPCDDLEWS